MTTQRDNIGFKPVWEGPFQKWSIKFIVANKWRFDPIYDVDDLLQDAYLTFRRVVAAYPRVVEAKHLMSLFQRAMWNEMHDKARRKRDKFDVEQIMPEDANLDDRIGELSNDGVVAAIVSELPLEAKLALKAMQDPTVLDKLRQKRKPSKLARQLGVGHERENLNMKLARILKLPLQDFIGPIKEALK